MATLTGFFSLVGSTIKNDMLAAFEYLKDVYNNGDIDYATAISLLVITIVLSFMFIICPRTIIIICFVAWRLYVHVVDDDDDDY